MVTSRSYDSDPTQFPSYLYYFQKNGKYFSLAITNARSDQKIVNQTATDIIATIK